MRPFHRRCAAAAIGAVLIVGGPMGCATGAEALAPLTTVQWKPEVSPVVPFRRDAEGRVVLNGALGARPVSILLDSGSGRPLVSETLIDPATMTRSDTALLNGQTRVGRWRGARIDLGPLSVEPDLVLAVDRTGRPDVVVGNPVFENAVVEIDFDAGTTTFRQSEGFMPEASAVAWPLARDGALVTATLSLNGGPPTCVIVDLGFQGSLLLSPSIIERQKLKENSARQVTVRVVGRAPIVVFGLERLERVTIAGFEVGNVSAAQGSHREGPCGSIVGTELLSGFRLVFDLPRNTLWLTPRADLAPRFETAMGITYRQTPTGMLVTSMTQSSPAYGVVQIGEWIARIDSDPVVFTMADGEQRRPPQSASPTAPPEGEPLAPVSSPPSGGSTAEGREGG